MGTSSEESASNGFLRKFASLAAVILGLGYIFPNLATVILLWYSFSQYTMTSVSVITHMCGVIMYIIAPIILMTVGVFIIVSGIQCYQKSMPTGSMFIGSMLASIYLLWLGVASSLVNTQLKMETLLLIISPILIMVGAASYMAPTRKFKQIGSTIGIVGGTLLAFAVFNSKSLLFVFSRLQVPFLGPFMSKSLLEGAAIVLGAVAVFVHSTLSGTREEPVSHILFSIVTLVYGIGLFVGPLSLSFSLWDIIWKATWLPPLLGAPGWIIVTTIFWSGSLAFLAIGGIVLTVSSIAGFMFAAQEFSQLSLMEQPSIPPSY